MAMSTEIFAHHAHVFPASVNPDGTIDRLLKLLDACGISEAVCFAPFSYQLKSSGIPDHNKWLAGELRSRSRLHGFGTIDFGRSDFKDQVRAIADLGFKGIKLHPQAQEFDILAPRAMDVYAAAQEQDLFCTFHSGVHHWRIKDYDVLKFDEVAHYFPDLRFSLEHIGGYSFFPQALAVIVNNIPFPPKPGRRPMVFGGFTSVFTKDYNRFWYLSPERLNECVAQAGAKQFIFGLDFPYNLEDRTRVALKTIGELELSAADRALILGGNLRRELGLERAVKKSASQPATSISPD